VAGVRRDAAAALRHVLDALRVPPGRLAIYGHSLGSAVAAELAAELATELGGARTPQVVILESPFTSARAMARMGFTRALDVAWSVISRIHYDTESRVRSLDAPVWVAHGRRDVIVPARMGEAVHAAARRKGELLLVPEAGHNDVADIAGEAYWRWIERALGGH
jgi:pimeloyl-ACP methyl ester carboxylesterase